MCLDKPSFTVKPSRQVRERIDLLKQDASLESQNKIKEIIHTEVRGGHGNARLMGWTKGIIDGKEALFATAHTEESLYDYKRGSKQNKEWANIEVGKDIYKFTRDEIHNMRNAGILSLVVLVSILTAFFI